MRVSIGHVFTDAIVEELKTRGFSFFKDPESPDYYQSYCCSLMTSENQATYIEIRQVLDEETYLKKRHAENFEPFEAEKIISVPKQSQPNTVNYFVKSLHQQDLEKSNIQQYFRIRKYASFWAVHLQCDNFEKFVAESRPEIFLKYEMQDAGLIHLNPSCFDLLVTAKYF